jgi:hypothetical protein
MLTEQAQDKRWQLGVDEATVLQRMLAGLRDGTPVVSEAESRWVITRLAELLEWPALIAGEGPDP